MRILGRIGNPRHALDSNPAGMKYSLLCSQQNSKESALVGSAVVCETRCTELLHSHTLPFFDLHFREKPLLYEKLMLELCVVIWAERERVHYPHVFLLAKTILIFS